MLPQVVQEPVSQWQSYPCTDRWGKRKQENVLAKFYENPERYAYSFQHYVLISRMQQVRHVAVCLFVSVSPCFFLGFPACWLAAPCSFEPRPPLVLEWPPTVPSLRHQSHPLPCPQDRKTRGTDKALRVLERSIFSDRQVFVRAMHSAGTMEDFEVSVYNEM
jgi:hypothetical protein